MLYFGNQYKASQDSIVHFFVWLSALSLQIISTYYIMDKTEISEVPLQFIKFAVVGIGSNITLYCLYLLFTYLGITPKYAMTFLYILGVAQTFLFNKRWTFKYVKNGRGVLSRYLYVYIFGYILNLSILYIMVDQHGFPHQIVQGFAIILVSCTLFLLQKKWVFK